MALTKCVACKSEVPADASICAICKSYQRPWMNWLQYGSGIAALVLLIVSGSTWLWANGRSSIWPRDDVRLISATTMGSAVIANMGDKEVFLSHLTFAMSGRTQSWIAPRLSIEQSLSPGQFLRREFSNTGLPKGAGLVRGVDEKKFEALIVRAVEQDDCVRLVFFYENDTSFQELRIMAGTSLNTFRVDGYLQYWSPGKYTPQVVNVSGSGVIFSCSAR